MTSDGATQDTPPRVNIDTPDILPGDILVSRCGQQDGRERPSGVWFVTGVSDTLGLGYPGLLVSMFDCSRPKYYRNVFIDSEMKDVDEIVRDSASLKIERPPNSAADDEQELVDYHMRAVKAIRDSLSTTAAA